MNVRPREPTTENDVYAAVVTLYTAIGAGIWPTRQFRRGPLRLRPGIPDLIVLLPRGKGVIFHELKAPKGKWLKGQQEFEADCSMSGVTYLLGGLDAARDELVRRGLLKVAA